ncbi:hypothetical protein HWV03_17720 [Moritella sp. 36]|uniref:hypothetical protein n=1 Tax=Moritella sp. 36 TaxID=2746233 RepID=UPI001BA66834|nr:hypothetical protein [Moritella sp. 36]QUM90500.1 hypothetical protein HWV03_17720 [Moritella sp. 36]
MKKIILASVLSMLPLMSFANNCTVPAQLDGLTLTTLANPLYDKKKTNAGTLAKVTFGAGTYDFKALNRTTQYTSNYTYQVIDSTNGIGLLEGTMGALNYTYTFKCLTDDSGIGVFTEEAGNKQNTFFYSKG